MSAEEQLKICLENYSECWEILNAENKKYNRIPVAEIPLGHCGVLQACKELLDHIAHKHLPIIHSLAPHGGNIGISNTDILKHLTEFPRNEDELKLLNQVLECAKKTIQESEDPKKTMQNVEMLSKLSNVSYEMADTNHTSVELNSISQPKKYADYETMGKILLGLGLFASIASVCAFAFIPTCGLTAVFAAIMIPLIIATYVTYVGMFLGVGILACAETPAQKVDNLSTRIKSLKARVETEIKYSVPKNQQKPKEKNGTQKEIEMVKLSP